MIIFLLMVKIYGYYKHENNFKQVPSEDQFYGDYFSLKDITHWMPLPELPEKI